MPVQINEVIIKAIVNPAPNRSNTENSEPLKNKYSSEEIIEKIFEIIREKKER